MAKSRRPRTLPAGFARSPQPARPAAIASAASRVDDAGVAAAGAARLSIICSVYNGAAFLPGYLTSLNQQSLEAFEVVFVDAGSTDASVELIRGFGFRAGIDVKLRVLESRIGLYAAWNQAIAMCSGDWIMNYNVDDRLFVEALDLLAAAAARLTDVGVIYSPCLISKDPGHRKMAGFWAWRDANRLEHLVLGNCCGPFPLVRRRCYEDHGLFDPSFQISGDYEMWVRLSLAGVRFHKLSIPLGIYYSNPAGLSTDPSRRQQCQQEDRRIRSRLQAALGSPIGPMPVPSLS